MPSHAALYALSVRLLAGERVKFTTRTGLAMVADAERVTWLGADVVEGTAYDVAAYVVRERQTRESPATAR